MRFNSAIRMATAGSSIVLLCLTIASLTFLLFEFQQARLEQENRGIMMARQLGPSLEYGVVINSPLYLAEVLEPFLQGPDLVYAEILDNQGKSLFYRENPTLPPPADKSRLQQYTAPIPQLQVLPDSDPDLLSASADDTPPEVGVLILGFDPDRTEFGDFFPGVSLQTGLLLLTIALTALAWAALYLFARPWHEQLQKTRQHVGKSWRRVGSSFSTPIFGSESRQLASLTRRLDRALAVRLDQDTSEMNQLRHRVSVNEQNFRRFMRYINHYILAIGEFCSDRISESAELSQTSEWLDRLTAAQGKVSRSDEEWFLPEQLIKRCCAATNKSARDLDIRIEQTHMGDARDREILARREDLKWLFRNILEHALEMSPTENIRVTGRYQKLSGDHIALTVMISGKGIKPDIRADYEPLRLPSEAIPDYANRALLLETLHSQIKALGGNINSETRDGMDKSELLFRFPARLPRPAIDDNEQTRDQSLSGSLLLMVPSAVEQIILQGVMDKFGLDVDKASDIEVARQKLAHKQYQLAVIDCTDARKQGEELVRELLALRDQGQASTRILCLHATEDEAAKIRESNLPVETLPKPVSKATLYDYLQRLLT